MWHHVRAAAKRAAGAKTSSSAEAPRTDVARFETQPTQSPRRLTSGNGTPRGTNGGASTPRSAARATSAVASAAGGGAFMSAGFWGELMLDPAKVDADLDHALLNARHNRRAGQMYANHKRPAPRGEHYPQKRARRVRFNFDEEEPASSGARTPRSGPGPISRDVRRAVAAARESASIAQSSVRGSGNPDGQHSSGGVTPRGMGHIEISSAPLQSSPSAGGPGAMTFDLHSLFGQARGALEHINKIGQTAQAPPPQTSRTPDQQRAPPTPASQGIFGELGWNLWGTPTKDADNARTRSHVTDSHERRAIRPAGGPSTHASGKENQGIMGTRASSSDVPFSPTKHSQGQTSASSAIKKTGSGGRRMSAEMQSRLERYQQAVAQASPTVASPKTPEISRASFAQRRHTALAISTATPSKSHTAPTTPAKADVHAPAESPTNSQPHTGPVFNRRPPTPAHGLRKPSSALQVNPAQAKPAGYLGARGLYSQGGGAPTGQRDIQLWHSQIAGLQAD
eukprot:Tamp_13195.p1 GENE.Tamp_13195~~Tamp_13195.p1  ORF type:complete len:560 (-),score=37.92 Tamp_13195:62-1594(-)